MYKTLLTIVAVLVVVVAYFVVTGVPAGVPVRVQAPVSTTTQIQTNADAHQAGEDGDPDSTVIITESDNGKTVKVPIDQYVALEYSKQSWTNTLQPEGVLVSATPPGSLSSVRGYFKAVSAGTAQLTSVGVPLCAAGQACSKEQTVIQVTLTVEQ